MNNFITDMILDKIGSEMLPASQLIDRLRKEGYTEDFELVNDLLMCRKNHHHYKVRDLTVDEIFRFYDDGEVLNGLVVYALHEPWDGLKGIFVAL